MNRQRLFLGVRIAVTALCLTACVLLVALWIRSYWWRDSIAISSDRIVASRMGYVGFLRSAAFARQHKRWTLTSIPLGSRDRGPAPWMFHYKGYSYANTSELAVPIWMVIVVWISFAATAWLPWRFSLRTFLIATTLIAVALAAIVYAAR